jgi:NAD+ synthase
MHSNQVDIQKRIGQTLQVTPGFIAALDVDRRIAFLKQQLSLNNQHTLVLGISGGIDSTVAGRLCQLAVEELRAQHYAARFVAVRLPYGEQLDEREAQEALRFINPCQVLTINIKQACDATMQSLLDGTHSFMSAHQQDFILGNIKARQRMIVQYALAGSLQGLVVGTDHAAEAVMGFFTKYGDGACDVAPLAGLTKRRVKAIGTFLGAPSALVNKKPTADLENLAPQRLDEDVHGITYEAIDDFLEGHEVTTEVFKKITTVYTATAHKRQLPIIPE